MENLQHSVAMIFGGLVAVTGLVLLFYGKSQEGTSRIKIFGQEIEISTSALVVFLAGCGIFVLPFFLPKPTPTGTEPSAPTTPIAPEGKRAQLVEGKHDREDPPRPGDGPVIWEIGVRDGDFSEFAVVESNSQFPWTYTAGSDSKQFPVEINDFARRKITIIYALSDKQAHTDLILTMAIVSVHGPDFSVRIQNEREGSPPQTVGEVTFDGAKTRPVRINKNIIGPGKNKIILLTTSPLQSNRWMFWDYLSLAVADR